MNKKRVTAKEIARELGVSVMTVSRALNNRPNVDAETRNKVLETARRLGYVPNRIAKSLVLKKSHIIGIVVPEITHSFFPEAIRGIEEVASRFGYHLILTHSSENAAREMEVIQLLESQQVDGILISKAETVISNQVYLKLIERKVPLVFFDRCVPGIGAECVSVDDENGASKITEHLILVHHYERIGHLSGPQHVSIGVERLRGFKKAHRKHNRPFYEELVVEAGFHESGGYLAMKKLLDLPSYLRPRAVVAVNDPAAFGAMKAISEHDLNIPGDIAIVGFSDDIRAELMPIPLTTVRQPAYEVGKIAAEKLIAQIEGNSDNDEIFIVQTEQVIRQSCGCLSKNLKKNQFQSKHILKGVR